MQTSFHRNLQQEKLGNLVGDILDQTSLRRCGKNRRSVCPDVFENLLIWLLWKRLPYKGDLPNPKSLVNPWFSHSQLSKKLLTSLTFLTPSSIVVETWWLGRPWRSTTLCPMPGRPGSSSHLRAKVRRLPLYLLLRLYKSERGHVLSNKLLPVLVMLWLRLPLNHLGALPYKSHSLRLGRA